MTASSVPMPRLPGAAVAVAAVWFGLALLAGATGFLARLPFPGPQLIILTLVVATFAAGTLVPALRDWIGALPIRALIGINAFRFIGAWFLVIAARAAGAHPAARRHSNVLRADLPRKPRVHLPPAARGGPQFRWPLRRCPRSTALAPACAAPRAR